ncbi:MAG TPA: YwiC-like family protein [Chthonomonadaceae bacterium]|nr:YwiC-like family protein [Chthonomonadaceae bacterium]
MAIPQGFETEADGATSWETAERTGAARRFAIRLPPIPREHGAWVILYAPMAFGFAVSHAFAPLRWSLLIGTATCAYLAREAAALTIRRRPRPDTRFWLWIWSLLTLAGALPLLAPNPAPLATIGALAISLFLIHTGGMMMGRLDRSVWGEMLGVAALALTAPAAFAVSTGGLSAAAWLCWIACVLFYGSSIFTVKMLVAAIRWKRHRDVSIHRKIVRDSLVYHSSLVVALSAVMLVLGRRAALWLAVAYLPAIVRAAAAAWRLTPAPPPFKRIGILEMVYSVWFSGCMVAVANLLR